MSEKKKVQVGVESTVTTHEAFDFSQFQQQLQEGEGATSSSRAAAANDPTPYHTAYQCRKTSICEGLTTEALVDEHRKSIAQLTTREIGRAVDINDLTGITLSKRHALTHAEYEADLDAAAYGSLGGYTFGMSVEEANKLPPQQ
jgi:hypothetical protein